MSPSTIAILGASANRAKFGNKSVRAFVHAGWSVFPIHLTAPSIEGLEVHSRLAEVPVDLEAISVYLPPPVTLSMLDEIAAVGASVVWFNPGSADERVLARARQLDIPFRDRCSIVDIGLSPGQFPA